MICCGRERGGDISGGIAETSFMTWATAPGPARRPEPVAEQQHLPVAVPHDSGDAADELGVREPQKPPLEWLPEPPRPGQQVIHGHATAFSVCRIVDRAAACQPEQ
jgi:hypothetical protein